MAHRKEPQPDEEMLAPMWVVTFGDLISLLVTFFVLIFTFSAMDQDSFRRISGNLSGALGVMTPAKTKSKEAISRRSAPLDAKTDVKGAQRTPERRELEEKIDHRIQDPSVFDKKVDFDELPDGFRIRLEGDQLFGAGSAILRPQGQTVLREIARFFRSEPVRLVVEAHTDPVTSAVREGMDATTLTRTMGMAMGRIIVEETGWSPARVGIAAMGAGVPIAENDDELGRARNRRVEILVIHDPKAERR